MSAQPTTPPPQHAQPPGPQPQMAPPPPQYTAVPQPAAGASAGGAAGVSVSDVASLEALGFERQAAVAALQNNGHNLEQAANWLFSQ